MIEALLKGKLSREQENMEDILTSNVFGLLRLMPLDQGLLPFLREAQLPDETKPLKYLTDVASVKFKFWPRYDETNCHPCEPDVVLYISEEGRKLRIVWIEAKFRSGKSSEESSDNNHPYDQLAREWDNLTNVAHSEHAEPLLIYLTADVCMPEQEIAASEDEYQRKRSNKTPFTCAWLSWRDLPTALTGCDYLAAEHLRNLTDRLEFHYFRGISPIEPSNENMYSFTPAIQKFAWQVDTGLSIKWGFAS